MTDLELNKFLQSDNVMDYDIRIRGNTKLYLVWIYLWGLEDFIELLKSAGEDFTESYEANFADDWICVDLGDFGLSNDLDEIFGKETA